MSAPYIKQEHDPTVPFIPGPDLTDDYPNPLFPTSFPASHPIDTKVFPITPTTPTSSALATALDALIVTIDNLETDASILMYCLQFRTESNIGDLQIRLAETEKKYEELQRMNAAGAAKKNGRGAEGDEGMRMFILGRLQMVVGRVGKLRGTVGRLAEEWEKSEGGKKREVY